MDTTYFDKILTICLEIYRNCIRQDYQRKREHLQIIATVDGHFELQEIPP